MSSLGELFFSLGLDSKEFDKAIDEAKKKVAELDSGSKIKLQLDVEHLKSQIQEATKSISANGVSINTKVNTERIENLRRLLEESKQQAKELEAAIANASTPPSIKAMKQRELQDVTKRIAEQEARLQSKTGTSVAAPPVPVRTVLDAESVNIVRTQLAKLGEPITAKISVEYDLEKFQAVETAMKNFGSRINQAINAGLPQGSIPKPSKTGERKGVAGWLDKVSETLFGDSADGGGYSTPAASAANISQVSSALGTLSKEIEALGNATEKISKRANGKKSVVSDEEAEMRKYYSQLQRLEEGVRRWQNVKAKIESSKIDKSSDNYKNAIRLIDAYIDKLVEAQKQAGKFTNRELTGMLGQTASGEIAKTGRLVAQQKSDEQTIRNNLVKEQAQIQRLEEGVRRIQNVIAKLNATDVDKSGSGYKQAISLLNDYKDKLNTAKRLAGSLSKREMAGMLGQTMSGEIAEAERLVAAQKKVEQSKKKTAKSVAQAEKEELQLKREKIKLQKEEANLGKARANQKKAELQKDKEAVRLKKERVSLQKKLGKAAGNVGNWASQLGNQLGNYISIYTIERFVRNLYTIGGEFQKQQIALRNMLGDVDKGNAIFERMKGLAVKSPFTFSELASYTKQMSAYGIEYENLYDTTKRLADISAGVGVDMGRLILAFGQVRSAAVLRGQELRQFTEAGIPLVNELAKKFSELEHRAVSTGEVFEKISKREVSFGMVKNILFDMTDPGGKFFQTQEQLAESLAGKWSNLKDAWDIMMADIANGHNTTLKGLAETLTWIVGHWEKFAPLVMGTVVALGAYRSIMTLLIPLQAAFFAATNIAPWVAIATILGGVTIAVTGYIDEAETALELSERLNTAAQKAESENTDKLNTASRYLDILKQQASVEEDKYALYQKQLKTFEELVKLYPKQMEGIEFEKLTLQEIENIRKRITEQAKKDILAGYDKSIKDALLAYTLERQRMAVKANAAGLTIDDYSKEEKKNLTDLYNVYTGLMNAKEEYEQSLLDKNKPATLKNWQEVAKKMADEYAKSKIYFKDPAAEHDIYAYFDHLEEVFKDAKSKYERATDESLRKPQKAIMNAANAINMAIGGRNLNYKEIDKSGKDAAKRDAKAYLDALKDELRKIGSQWSLFKELMDATGNRQLSLNLSGLSGTDFRNQLEHLRSEMTKELQKAGVNLSAADVFNMSFDELAKIVGDEEKLKRIKEIYDTYHNANRDLRMETIKDFAEIIKASRDFESKIAEIERKLQEDLSKLRLGAKEGGLDLNSDEYKRAEQKLREEAEKAKANERFEEFKASSDWVKVFDDLDRVATPTLNDMLDKMEAFIYQIEESPEAMKEMLKALGDVREKLSERNPFGAFARWLKEIRNIKEARWLLAGNDSYTFQQDLYGFKAGQKITPEILDNLEKGAVSDFNLALSGTSAAFENLKSAVEPVINLFSDGESSVGLFLSVIGDAISGALNMSNSFSSLMGLQIGSGENAKSLGSMLGIQNAGFWGAAAGAAVGMLSSVFAMHDKALQKEIEASEAREKAIKNMAENLEGLLSKNIGGIYTFKISKDAKKEFEEIQRNYQRYLNAIENFKNGKDIIDSHQIIRQYSHLKEETIAQIGEALSSEKYYDAQKASLMVQRDEIEKQRKAEEEKKKTDANKIADYDQQLREVEQQLKDFALDMANELWGIDFKSWANQLTESLVNAWSKGEDAVLAYKNTVSDILRDLGVSMISQKIIEPLLEDTMNDFLAQFDKDNGELTDNSMKILAGMYEGADKAASATEAYLEGLKKLGVDISETNESSSSGLSKGVQSITENTADLLASYVNAMRADVSVNRTLFEQLVNESVPRMSMLAESQLTQLRMVADNTRRNADAADRIYELVNRVVDKGSNKLKV